MRLSMPEFPGFSRSQVIAVLLCAFVIGSVGGPVAAQAASDLMFDDSASAPAPNPYIHADSVDKEIHVVGDYAPLEVENDQGELTHLPAHLNDSSTYRNRYKFVASDINASEYGQFPRKSEGNNRASALDASEWTVGGANSSKGSTADVTTAPNVDGVELATDGSMGSNDVVTFTYSNFSVTSDAEKRYLQLVVDVTTLDSGAQVTINATESDGDTKTTYIDSGMSRSSDDVLANATGDGQVIQVQLGTLTTNQTGINAGDGTFGAIDKLVVTVEDADATMQFAGINAEKLSQWSFGSKAVDTDSDDEYETSEHVEPSGEIAVSDVSTLGSSFDGAIIRSLTVEGLKIAASDLPSSDVKVEDSTADKYDYPVKRTIYYRLSALDLYDVTWNNLELRETTDWPGSRYVKVGHAENVDDNTDFSDVSYTSITGSYDSLGKNVTLDSTVTVGQNHDVKYVLVLEQQEADAMVGAGGSGGGGGGFFGGAGGGGIWSMIWGPIGGAVSAVLAAIGLRRRGRGG